MIGYVFAYWVIFLTFCPLVIAFRNQLFEKIYRGYHHTQVNRMSRSRRVLAIGGKQRILRLDMVCIETILFHLDSL